MLKQLPLMGTVGEVIALPGVMLAVEQSFFKGGGFLSNSLIIACTTRPKSECIVNYGKTKKTVGLVAVTIMILTFSHSIVLGQKQLHFQH